MITMYDNPWDVRDSDFPAASSTSDQLRFLINYSVLAPSSHNTQPWLFAVRDNYLNIYADRTRALPVIDPDDRELVMSCGAALFHLVVAARRFGFEGKYSLLPDSEEPNLMARFRLGERYVPVLTDLKLFEAIMHRRTNRKPFEKKGVPDSDLKALAKSVETEGAHLDIVVEDEKTVLADIIAEGDRIQGDDKHFRRELAAWVHPSRSQSRDGIPGYASGAKDLRTYTGPFLVRTFDWGEGRAARDRQLAEGSPALLILSTDDDRERDWLTAGVALDHLLLQAHDYRLSASFLNQPIEISNLRPRVADQLQVLRHPQTILRIGYGGDARRTPRRPVADVLVDSEGPV